MKSKFTFILSLVLILIVLTTSVSCSSTTNNNSITENMSKETDSTQIQSTLNTSKTQAPNKPIEIKTVDIYNGTIQLPNPGEKHIGDKNSNIYYNFLNSNIFFAFKPYIDALINNSGGMSNDDNQQKYLEILSLSGDNTKVLDYDTIEILNEPTFYVNYTKDINDNPQFIQEVHFIVDEYYYQFSVMVPYYDYTSEELETFKELFLKIMGTLNLNG